MPTPPALPEQVLQRIATTEDYLTRYVREVTGDEGLTVAIVLTPTVPEVAQ